MNQYRPFAMLTGLILSIPLCLPGLVSADDSEIFFGRGVTASTTSATNVLFMFDNSGSMVNTDGGTTSRMARIKDAMYELLDSTDNINMGVGAFNGQEVGGNILYPVTNLSADLCPGATCTSLTIQSRMQSGADDATESLDGSVALSDNSLVMVDDFKSAMISSTTANVTQDVVAPGPTTLTDGVTQLKLFYDGGVMVDVGLHFGSVLIPAGATIYSAQLRLSPQAGGSAGNISARIIGEASANASPFTTTTGSRLSDRTRTSASVTWWDISTLEAGGVTLDSPDIRGIVQEQVDQAGWSQGNALNFIMELPPGYLSNASNYRYFSSMEAGNGPQLIVKYTMDAVDKMTTGLRFPALNVPRGATITDARIKFRSAANDAVQSALQVKAHAIGNSPQFEASSGNLNNRTRTTAQATWNPSSWSGGALPYQSDDLSPVIQEMVNRTDWCGGNALSILIDGTGMREAISYDRDPHQAPFLQVTYDPSTVDMSGTCLSQRQSIQISHSIDDAVEDSGSGVVNAVQDVIDLGDSASMGMAGLRFRDVRIPNGATIGDAWIEFTSVDASADVVSLSISGDMVGYSSSINPALASDLSDRTRTASTVTWNLSGSVAAESKMRSPDISSVVQEIVNGADWSSMNNMTLLLERTSGTGVRTVHAFDGDAGVAARLMVSYQIDSPALSGVTVKLQTARDELRQVIGELTPRSWTPLVDLLYEGGIYMRGDGVEFGKQRGYQTIDDRWFRLSHPDSYTGGNVVRAANCFETDLDARECINERIAGSPIYDSPISSSCQANQIVLLSDGEATRQGSADLIKTLIGTAACEDTGSINEQCGYELADWLYNNDQSLLSGNQNVVTHTVGFNFSSDFLRTLAQKGGGGFYEAGSAAELSTVFQSIIRNVADINTSFVAPAASVSQFNRLANRNDVYFALFKPGLSTRWDGNLKRYQLGKVSGDNAVSVLDREGAAVFDSATGAFNSSAKSYWHAGTDGGDVTKGGAVSQMELTRTIKTALPDGSGGLTLVDLHESTLQIDKATLGISAETDDYRTRLLQWARGVDINDFDSDADVIEVRAQMGDPMHSQPALLNYESTLAQGESMIFVGTNEGFLHAIDSEYGSEAFAYMPASLLPNIDALFRNAGDVERTYGVDGNITAWIDDADGDMKVDTDEDAYVVFGMRRGGREYHALNVTDRANPTVAWTITGGTGDFSELGQSWSTPVKTLMRIDGVVKHVLVFGGGYDPINDDRELREATDSMGRAIYIVDAVTGELVKSITSYDFADMDYSIPSQVSVLDMNSDGLADRFYVGDMGGQLWRFDIEQSPSASEPLSVTGGVIAELGTVGTRNNRRFYYEPDISMNYENDKQYLSIAIGSGWRAHPLDVVVEDRFFVIKDYAVFGPPRDADNAIVYSSITDASLFNATSSSTITDTGSNSDNGWYIDLVENGEKVLSSSVTINDQIIFTTYLPDTEVGECSASVGGGRVYVVDSLTGQAVLNLDGVDSTDGELTLTDRYKHLSIPGIPPGASVLFPESDDGSPTLFTGTQRVADDLDAGPLLKRTYWYESSMSD